MQVPAHFASQFETNNFSDPFRSIANLDLNMETDLSSPEETQNNYKIIKGQISLIGRQPDGDSLGFIADKLENFDGVYRSYLLKPSSRDKSVQLRFEGIDAPELHYGTALQPFGKEARDYLVEKLLKFVPVYKQNSSSATPSLTVESSEPVSVPVFIATNGLEIHGRPISYLFEDTGQFEDGKIMLLDASLLTQSLNYKILEAGYAFLLAYSSMPFSHFQKFKEAANQARRDKIGIWSKDATHDFILADLTSIEGEDAQLIYPKLFRRCVDFFKSGEVDFKKWLREKDEENDQVRITETTVVDISSLIQQVNDHIYFQADTNDIIFIEK